jgi:hypothetical protein
MVTAGLSTSRPADAGRVEIKRTPDNRAPKGKLADWLLLETSRPIGARTLLRVVE